MKFKVGDIVFVSNPDLVYEEEFGARGHENFFGVVTEVNSCDGEIVVGVEFENETEWFYDEDELSHASEIKDMTLEEFSNKFGVVINAVYL